MYSAVILAGGLGTRLRPLTDTVPKPMLPVGGEPNLIRLCEHLCKNGFENAVVTLKYLPDKIKEQLSDSCRGVDLKYVCEDEPLGTAGAVKAVSDMLCDDFLVISGDAVCTLDLSGAREAHIKSGALVTIITHTSKEPLQYGCIVSDNGRITTFCEKPSWQQVVSDKVNTGIYFLSKRALDYIPGGVSCDFSRDVFPKMLYNGELLFAYEAEGYWRDIGSFSEYLAANRDMISFSKNAETEGSVYGDDFRLGRNSAFINSVAFDGVSIADNCSVVGSILARNVTVGDGCVLRDGCVIGEGAVINDGVHLGSGTVIGTGKTVVKSKGDEIMVKNNVFSDGGVTISDKEQITTEIYRLARAVANAADGYIGVCHDSTGKREGEAEMLSYSLCESGAHVYDYGRCTKAMAKAAGYYFGTVINLFLSTDGQGYVRIDLFDETGMELSASAEKRICDAYKSEPEKTGGGKIEKISGLSAVYGNALTRSADLHGVSVTVIPGAGSDAVEQAYKIAGAKTDRPVSPYTEKDEFTVNLSDGSALLGQNNVFCSFDSCLLILLSLIPPDEHPVISLPYFMPRIYEKTAKSRGIRVLKYLCKPSYEQQADTEARRARALCTFCHDPAFCAAALMSELKKNRLTLSDAVNKYAKGVIRRTDIKVSDKEKAACMRRLYEAYMPYQLSASDGVSVVEGDAEGVAMATDSDRIRIVISADSEEAAEDAVGEIMMRLGRS